MEQGTVERVECERCGGRVGPDEDGIECVTCDGKGTVFSYGYRCHSSGGVSVVVQVLGWREPQGDWLEHQLHPELDAVSGLLLDRAMRLARNWDRNGAGGRLL